MMALLMAPFFIPLIARLWLKEPISGKSLLAICLGFAGAAVILRPAEDSMNIYIALALLCAALVAVSKCAIRQSARLYILARTFVTGAISRINIDSPGRQFNPASTLDDLNQH